MSGATFMRFSVYLILTKSFAEMCREQQGLDATASQILSKPDGSQSKVRTQIKSPREYWNLHDIIEDHHQITSMARSVRKKYGGH